ncbi:biotin/lipoyl-containing protein [Shewanella frigidimarina]|jgi:pyruvate dehydrogenase E2 component (dihydrolipoamide acetyltransferase)|uniref:Biotin/lipoyl attachment domain-containing protein n=1 Tax=Shewanella frigidimarina (strain NCIMB 400) TaxID=318167 RepID=Q088Y5_SHEFN|nr:MULTISPECIES: biotin/lipoyl-containing protein [Shewanella]MBB1381827.1 hypothetical protein [Shewanella sp. SR41-2]HBF47303.1 hypothetical protein [Shewanella frigidimarina]ABI70180.1 biotin/lipoyl attachment domain-containing protein [Shewanella frigidimarina NCIMB 400]MBB1426121.1 hypothetical protein [Shewanella sp. SG44-2]PKI06876.1 hypothetical protein CXF78_08220 [Shewanella sp. 11B5]|tara:strand:- start:925 stop:1224 length:300 start_codon:yes stop_codon:yes gene_type:complete
MANNINAITMPKFGLTMEKGSVSAWHVEVGKTVAVGDEIADIETEKVTSAYESPIAGTWRRSVASVGDELPIGSLIGVMASPEIDDAQIDSFIAKFTPT